MHKEFRKLLDKATGSSQFVVAANVDIRGFSSFSTTVESSEVAVFIKRVYMKLEDDYFSTASFFKPTGDGLLVIVPYTEQNLKKIVTNTVRICRKVVKDFPTLCKKDPMINFEVPGKVGIGLSRGSACCLCSGNKILDYSGGVLNLATRLMDLARPSGIVFDSSFGIQLLGTKLRKLFAKETVYIKGIAERKPVRIFYTKEYTTISPLHKHPIEHIKWKSQKHKITLNQIRNFAPRFIYDLPSTPLASREIRVKIAHALVKKGRKQKGIKAIYNFEKFEYFLEAGKPRVRLYFDTLAKELEKDGVKGNWEVEIEITYPEK